MSEKLQGKPIDLKLRPQITTFPFSGDFTLKQQIEAKKRVRSGRSRTPVAG